MIAVSFLIFGGSGSFTYGYQKSCLEYTDNTASICKVYNPFYASELYQTTTTKKWWSDLRLTKSDFNQSLLNEFICDQYEQKYETQVTCNSGIYDDPENFVLPHDVPVGRMTQKLLHYTVIFQSFVFLQLWNQFNARHIEDTMNPFKGFFTNFTFLGIIVFATVVQIIMVELGGEAVKTWPLNKEYQYLSIAFGALSIIIGQLIKFLPVNWFDKMNMDETPMEEEEAQGKLANSLKKSSTLRARESW